jgi:hypothetical protein
MVLGACGRMGSRREKKKNRWKGKKAWKAVQQL